MKLKIFFYLLIFILLFTSCAVTMNDSQTISSAEVDSEFVVSSGSGVESSVNMPAVISENTSAATLRYPIGDTSQGICYDNQKEVPCESLAASFDGQDAQYVGNQASYLDNGDGTVTDLVTRLMWQQDPGEKMTYSEAAAGADDFSLAGYDDWRLPTIKELYSLILFDGEDVSICKNVVCDAKPFIDTRYFGFQYGDLDAGERAIDSQFASSTLYVSTTMNGSATMFGVNFADGRIKGYGFDANPNRGQKTFYVLYVRGGDGYGENDFVDNGNGTITDQATGLTWMQSDSGKGMDWEDALRYCETLDFVGSEDWRLPNAKELQSIVDYSRSPDTTNSPAIDPLFATSSIINEMGETDYPFYWTSTTHASSNGNGSAAVYVSFGEATGNMNGTWMDVHGAGAQRSDPKSGDPYQFPDGRGPQGDAIHIENYVRCVSDGEGTYIEAGVTVDERPSMDVESNGNEINLPGRVQNQVDITGNAPDHGGIPGGQAGPPEEAISACAASTVGESCLFNSPSGEVSGVCQEIQQELACVPENTRSHR
jgi:hypothetical protein